MVAMTWSPTNHERGSLLGRRFLLNRHVLMGSCGGSYIVFVSCTSIVVGKEFSSLQDRFKIKEKWYECEFQILDPFEVDPFKLRSVAR